MLPYYLCTLTSGHSQFRNIFPVLWQIAKTVRSHHFLSSLMRQEGRLREWWQPCHWRLRGSCLVPVLYIKQQWHGPWGNLSHTCGGIPLRLWQSVPDWRLRRKRSWVGQTSVRVQLSVSSPQVVTQPDMCYTFIKITFDFSFLFEEACNAKHRKSPNGTTCNDLIK